MGDCMRLGSHLAFALVTVAATSAFGGIGKNGVQMNGVQMNGVQMNGVQMNGVQMNGVQMNGVQMDGVAVSGLNLDGTWLNGTIVGSAACRQVVAKSQPLCTYRWSASCDSAAATLCKVTPEQLKGAVFTADTNAGARFLRLDSYELLPDPAPVWKRIGKYIIVDVNADVYAYH